MVEYTFGINDIFSALSDPIRRDILERAIDTELTVNEIAIEYDVSLAAVSKHLKVLSDAELINKRKDGRYIYIRTRLDGMRDVATYMQQYEQLWNK